MSLIFLEHAASLGAEPLITVQLPDGSTSQKRSQDLLPNDMIVFDYVGPIEYQPQPMVWDFDA